METLEQYFTYEKDYGKILKIYNNLSKELKNLHENNMIVPTISSKTIVYDDGFKFDNAIESLDIDVDVNNNKLPTFYLNKFTDQEIIKQMEDNGIPYNEEFCF